MGQLLAGAVNHQSGGRYASTTVPAEEAHELFHEVDVDNSHASRETLDSKRFVRSAATNIERFFNGIFSSD
jgi:hypothetical protein